MLQAEVKEGFAAQFAPIGGNQSEDGLPSGSRNLPLPDGLLLKQEAPVSEDVTNVPVEERIAADSTPVRVRGRGGHNRAFSIL